MIGENIKTLRKAYNLTQPEFAKIVGISRNSLSRYENGTSSISTELIDRKDAHTSRRLPAHSKN